MNNYGWILEFLSDLEKFSKLNDLGNLGASLKKTRSAFQSEMASVLDKGSDETVQRIRDQHQNYLEGLNHLERPLKPALFIETRSTMDTDLEGKTCGISWSKSGLRLIR